MRTRAQALRANSSPVERRMWRLLYPFRTGGFHFRKRSPIGPYVGDFVCHHARLVIEVDGDTHCTERAMLHDAQRDRFLRAEGYRVLRIPNAEVMSNPDGVYRLVEIALATELPRVRSQHPLPNPPHKGEGAPPSEWQYLEPSTDNGHGTVAPQSPDDTSPLVGEVGRGVSQ